MNRKWAVIAWVHGKSSKTIATSDDEEEATKIAKTLREVIWGLGSKRLKVLVVPQNQVTK
jgi:hypothetical protein